MSETIYLKKSGEGLYEEKKSRFIAVTYPVKDPQEAQDIIDETRKKYWDARHNCYAYAIGPANEVTKCSDDGEPSGTAGRPILEVITGSGVHNCLVIVTRYFGGTLLGTGGLVRAYTKSASEAIKASLLVTLTEGARLTVRTDYNSFNLIKNIAADGSAAIKDIIYDAGVTMIIECAANVSDVLFDKITDATSDQAVIEVKDAGLIEIISQVSSV